MSEYKHYNNEVGCLNQDGEPDAAIPLPHIGGLWIFRRFRCGCGKKFKTKRSYNIHYRLENESEWFMED